ncbi:hypothetical protein FAF44_37565 [Nonomuraea sp. MG754425]|uniref:hypothetical protein n=1 Tax=Nonomuraea sp. MG754425 TaxID=2570319 RepID=UPI001F458D3F|nr:hypothetical protein [Nonomuraea sp. MG754425]MCF6474052.1 hypothetical protein [Nonomuraea sp. MG754425]
MRQRWVAASAAVGGALLASACGAALLMRDGQADWPAPLATVTGTVSLPSWATMTAPAGAHVQRIAEFWVNLPSPGAGPQVPRQVTKPAEHNPSVWGSPTDGGRRDVDRVPAPLLASSDRSWPQPPALSMGEQLDHYRFYFYGPNPTNSAAPQATRWLIYKGPYYPGTIPHACQPTHTAYMSPPYGPTPPPISQRPAIFPTATYSPARFFEFDVRVYPPTGSADVKDFRPPRGAERFVFDSYTKKAWYTPDHYCHFYPNPFP